ncbi:hypothetical protein X798_05740 [Onchocerca flexuosa]|uniref:Uncharacterized protein n=1 Tax=Onchocerca flexuosa TaxID=387005 RepID=A0A238BPE6_9BILA|nr:hypothetical protein X798_05740 [Onchocerca flexuosa]
MGSKVTTTSVTALKEQKIGKGNRNQFWSTDFIKNDEKTSKRAEIPVSQQFLSQKKYGINETWSKQMQESREDLKQPFPYTPFKSGSLSKKTAINVLRDVTLNANLPNQNSSQVFGAQQQPGTSAIPRPEPKGTWRRPETGIIPPPPGPYRPASAMNMPILSRPASRANSDLGIGTIAFCDNIGNLSSRYQSYCTLPRPEQIDFDQHSNYGNEISQMAKQINQLYGPYNAQVQVQPSVSPNPINKQGMLPGSRPASSMLAGAPGMASDYLTRRHSIHGPVEPNALQQVSDEEVLKPAKEIISFDALSVLSVLQVYFL